MCLDQSGKIDSFNILQRPIDFCNLVLEVEFDYYEAVKLKTLNQLQKAIGLQKWHILSKKLQLLELRHNEEKLLLLGVGLLNIGSLRWKLLTHEGQQLLGL